MFIWFTPSRVTERSQRKTHHFRLSVRFLSLHEAVAWEPVLVLAKLSTTQSNGRL